MTYSPLKSRIVAPKGRKTHATPSRAREVAKNYYKSIGAADEPNCLRLAACAQLGRTATLQHQAKVLAEKKVPKEMVEAKEKEGELRSKHAGSLGNGHRSSRPWGGLCSGRVPGVMPPATSIPCSLMLYRLTGSAPKADIRREGDTDLSYARLASRLATRS